eukprot:1155518-Pelagomonas_calceolata.AAC.9
MIGQRVVEWLRNCTCFGIIPLTSFSSFPFWAPACRTCDQLPNTLFRSCNDAGMGKGGRGERNVGSHHMPEERPDVEISLHPKLLGFPLKRVPKKAFIQSPAIAFNQGRACGRVQSPARDYASWVQKSARNQLCERRLQETSFARDQPIGCKVLKKDQSCKNSLVGCKALQETSLWMRSSARYQSCIIQAQWGAKFCKELGFVGD